MMLTFFVFFFQAEDGIRDDLVTGVQTCALPIFSFFCAAFLSGQTFYCPCARRHSLCRWPPERCVWRPADLDVGMVAAPQTEDRKSTRLNSSHQIISYAVFCLKKKNITHNILVPT